MDGCFEFAEEGGGNGNAASCGHHAHTINGEVTDENNGEDPDGHYINIYKN